MGTKKQTNSTKSKKNNNKVKKSKALKYLSYLMIGVAILQVAVIGLQIVSFYMSNKQGRPSSWLVVANETIIFAIISIFQLLMGIQGKKGADGDKRALKKCRSFSMVTIAFNTLYVFIAIITKSEKTLRLVTQFIYPIAFYFVTFMPYIQSQMEIEEKDIKAELKKMDSK